MYNYVLELGYIYTFIIQHHTVVIAIVFFVGKLLYWQDND